MALGLNPRHCVCQASALPGCLVLILVLTLLNLRQDHRSVGVAIRVQVCLLAVCFVILDGRAEGKQNGAKAWLHGRKFLLYIHKHATILIMAYVHVVRYNG